MKKRLAILDDDLSMLTILTRRFEKFNTASEHHIELDCFSDPDEFISKFDHHWGLIDLNLQCINIDGFGVAKEILRRHAATVIINSTDINEDEDADSLMSKCNMKASEIFDRFWKIDDDPLRNAIQIHMRAEEHSREH